MESTAMVLSSNSLALGSVDPAAIAAAEAAKAEIQSAYIMALKKPRNEQQSRVNILAACRRPQFADKVEYCKPVGGQKIKGPSIRFAELALREWGNVRSSVQVVYEDDYIRRVKVTITDMQTNACFGKDIQINKTIERRNGEDREVLGERLNSKGNKVYIVKATEDEMANKEAAAVSKILRNEGLRLIPTDIIEEALAIARQTIESGYKSDPDKAMKTIVDTFSKIGVSPVELERYLKHPLSGISPSELTELQGIYHAIKDGESKWADLFEGNGKDDSSEQAAKAKNKIAELKNRTKNTTMPAHDPQTGEVKEEVSEQQTSVQTQETQAEDKPPFDEAPKTITTPTAATSTQNGNGNGVKRTRGL